MPTPTSHLSHRRYVRLRAALARLDPILDDLDLDDRTTPLAPGFAGPRRRIVAEIRKLLNRTPFQLAHRPRPGDLFVAVAATLQDLAVLFSRHRAATNRHAYPRSPRREYDEDTGSE